MLLCHLLRRPPSVPPAVPRHGNHRSHPHLTSNHRASRGQKAGRRWCGGKAGRHDTKPALHSDDQHGRRPTDDERRTTSSGGGGGGGGGGGNQRQRQRGGLAQPQVVIAAKGSLLQFRDGTLAQLNGSTSYDAIAYGSKKDGDQHIRTCLVHCGRGILFTCLSCTRKRTYATFFAAWRGGCARQHRPW